MKITFIGATLGVTGSKTLFESGENKILIDCGLYQEGASSKELNLEELPFNTKELDAVIITHAHLDHTGFLPVLFKNGFRGPIFLTPATTKLARIILEDSAGLMDEETKPLYTKADVVNIISLFKPIEFHEEFKIKDIKVKFHFAGHILGAAFVEIKTSTKSIIFSGDLGRRDDPLFNKIDKLPVCDFLVTESTYGGVVRPKNNMQVEMENLLSRIIKEKKILLIPAFALHRTELLTYLINHYLKMNNITNVPFYLNSPMMEAVMRVYNKYLNSFKITEDELKDFWTGLHFLKQYWDIEKVNQANGPQIILASSGMLTGGRIWTHLKDLAKRDDVIIFIPGFQAPGTQGHEIVNGARTLIGPEKEEIMINAEVIHSESFSSHADQADIIDWIGKDNVKEKVFLIHGEEQSKLDFTQVLKQKEINFFIPKHGETVELN